MYICRKFRFNLLFFENHDKLNIKKIDIEKKRRAALLWAELGRPSCNVRPEKLASTALRRRMRADGLDARDGTLTPTKVTVEDLIPGDGGERRNAAPPLSARPVQLAHGLRSRRAPVLALQWNGAQACSVPPCLLCCSFILFDFFSTASDLLCLAEMESYSWRW
jgi:hypothetical protein